LKTRFGGFFISKNLPSNGINAKNLHTEVSFGSPVGKEAL
jgi:hypothetical protein